MNLKFNNKISVLKNLSKTYGIGKKTSLIYCKKVGLNSRNNPRGVKKKRINLFMKWNSNILLNKKLRSQIKETLLFLYKIRAYRGIRTKQKYPCRGQRTHTNAKTKKKFKV